MRAYLLGGRPIHFPFLSGIFQYDCTPCDAPCCHGASLGIGRSRELVTLLSVQPQVALFAHPGFASSTMLSLVAPKESCWFLGQKKQCRLEEVAGRDVKPAGCRLFPFQTVRSIGESVTVLPDFLCPLQVADAPSEHGPASHDELALELHRTGVPRGGHAPLTEPSDLPWHEATLLERRIVDASSAHLYDSDYLAFADAQRTLTARVLGASRRRIRAEDHFATILRFLGSHAEPSREAVHELVALTGTLRLFASPLSRREMPSVLVALSALVGVYESMRGAKRSARTTVSIFRERLPFLYVLAHLHDHPVLLRAERAKRMIAKLPAVRPPLLDVLETLLHCAGRPTERPLLEILCEQGEAFAAPLSTDAVTMLTGLGKVLLRAGAFEAGLARAAAG